MAPVPTNTRWSTAAQIAAAVNAGEVSASAVIDAALARIARLNPSLNAFTAVTAERARAKARALDATRDKKKLPLAGVPFAVKNLFDVEGLATVAGSKINRAHPPAERDATLIEWLEAAGAVLVGTLNMGEYAYDFTGENVHDGPSRNPHDLTRMSGGSSGGSGSAVGGGMVPLALGSDTNGSIRVPSSLCGIFGLKPTYGRLSRARTFPFVVSLDHLGPFARSTRDLAISYDAMQGTDSTDPAHADRAPEPATPQLLRGFDGLRIVVAGGYFKKGASPEALEALSRVATAVGAKDEIEIPEAARAIHQVDMCRDATSLETSACSYRHDLRQVDVHRHPPKAEGVGAATMFIVSSACAMRSAISSRQGAAMICTPIGKGLSGTGTATTGSPMKEIGCV